MTDDAVGSEILCSRSSASRIFHVGPFMYFSEMVVTTSSRCRQSLTQVDRSGPMHHVMRVQYGHHRATAKAGVISASTEWLQGSTTNPSLNKADVALCE